MFKWIIKEKLAGSSIPICTEDIKLWKKEGIKAVVVLTENEEISRYWTDASYYFEILKNNGFEYIHSPVKDFHAPTLEQLISIVNWINGKILTNKPVVVHCHGGIGRTGIVLASYLIKNGIEVDKAIYEVRNKIPFALEVEEQLDIVYKYYYWNKKLH